VTTNSICRTTTRLSRFSLQILRMRCNSRIPSPVLQIRSPQAFLPRSLDLLTCSPDSRGRRPASRKPCPNHPAISRECTPFLSMMHFCH
jgi:hypothetical protein